MAGVRAGFSWAQTMAPWSPKEEALGKRSPQRHTAGPLVHPAGRGPSPALLVSSSCRRTKKSSCEAPPPE